MYWKFLRTGQLGPITRFAWPTGDAWVGSDQLQPCRHGVHACRADDLPFWLSDELWTVELRGPVEEGDRKVVATSGRLVEQVMDWTADAAGELAAACVRRTAEHASAELANGGLVDQAERLQELDLKALRVAAQQVAADPAVAARSRAARLCLYVADAVEATEEWPVASVAYIAARAAGQRSDPSALVGGVAEREWQARWMREHLRLDG